MPHRPLIAWTLPQFLTLCTAILALLAVACPPDDDPKDADEGPIKYAEPPPPNGGPFHPPPPSWRSGEGMPAPDDDTLDAGVDAKPDAEPSPS
jgi:hypothetical protein